MPSSAGAAGWLALAALAGALLPVQIAANGRLAEATGSALAAASVSNSVGLVVLALLLAAGALGRPRWAGARSAPAWAFLGGAAGAAFVAGSALAAPALGVALASGLIVGGQALAALTIDHFGWFGQVRRPLGRDRQLALAVLAAAVALLVRG